MRAARAAIALARAACARTILIGLIFCASAWASPPATAHWVSVDEVLARIQAPANRERFGVLAVSRQAELPRLLVVRVDDRWNEVSAEARRATAEHWRSLWREANEKGIVAITDAAGRSLVSFDGHGSAIVKPAPAPDEG